MHDHDGFFHRQNSQPAAGRGADWPPQGGNRLEGPDASAPDPFSAPDLEVFGSGWEFEEDLTQLLRTSAEERAWTPILPDAVVPRPGEPSRRRQPPLRWKSRTSQVPWLHLLSLVFAALTCVIVSMISVLGGMISYDPLRELASPGLPRSLAGWWPALVYGPWLVGSLSILRAAVHRRHVTHSWAVVVLFSAVAVFLCVLHASKTLAGVAVAGLPPLTALVSFHQLVRQITLTSPPRHALPRQRSSEHC